MFTERLKELEKSHTPCTIFTLFGQATGTILTCDGEIFVINAGPNRVFRLFCEDVVGLAE